MTRSDFGSARHFTTTLEQPDLEKYGVRQNYERFIQGCGRFTIAASDFFQDLVIACASVGVAHIDLIEHVIECLPIVHLALQTA